MISHIYDKTDLEAFVEDIVVEAALIAPVVEVLIAGNDSEHMRGNVYLVFQNDEDADKVLANFNRRWYAGKPVYALLSPVHDLRTAVCRQAEISKCDRGGQCNYVHPLNINKSLLNSLWASQQVTWS
ncbi:Splicing factor U2AF subunit [Wickerhamiella sorbophila]|uniref:Splicing factor U2AF subunit n=1 Tax=Wickerhamiella sorbophila TaxID=45607 RepID=A0A2T0FJM6_9ASCO|nr:Splicing factor U2AF subunit [Wickerhamiella sorbophila]PRT55191.1 Splicing factor U2AF subunit [Wickerhamiella sorbophila]